MSAYYNASYSSNLGVRSHSEFTLSIFDAFCGNSVSSTSTSDGQPGNERSNWQCTPICLNAIFCPYCVLARQAHSIYQDEYLEMRNAVMSQQRVSSMISGIDDEQIHIHQQQQQNANGSQYNNSNHQDPTTVGGDAPNQNNGSFHGSLFSSGTNNTNNNHQTNNNNTIPDGKFLSETVDDECCCCECPTSCIRSLKTCGPRCMICLDNTLPPTCHWTCLSAMSIDAASLAVGGLFLETFSGVFITGLAMQVLLTRQLVRRRLGLSTETLNDIVAGMLLPCCAAAQQHQEIVLRRNRSGMRDYGAGLIMGHWTPSSLTSSGGGGNTGRVVNPAGNQMG